ncbi:DUF433 domain-containing protein [Mesorhizobium sp. M1A.F.Ca.IN.022.05.2.1]|uniref:DUF433 domain-containing protein n=2 Tax=Mesorhizobium TaxID=68287 RepID=UPI000FCA54AF|nr:MULTISPECIES: DUF433 domain-containing protein [unclassified Mesorhizobium]RUV82278.1 DUF433 domain-containing protein [Mesorhizobium sp. M1A.F.Ca.IN.020.32.1.1]RUW04463.1 DUF433 domain-containing protein [Mesorhizobium sp. M1A.F.Ca.IN.022.05.2.1]RWF82925.1 MAG: DUF433 domain-containing protein [Mesorhizobium sp.]RWG05679.1 MAG: DUF433 domain-containing protein [Mesorhizobium sp.]TIS43839.1 MAG: DUF433 domain-containing protein [Mesorhizobium sp.]
MSTAEALTLTEAGYVLNRSPTSLNKAVDKGVIRARQRRVGRSVQRLLGPAEMRYLLVANRLEKDLTPTGRRRLYEAIRQLSADAHRVTLGEIELDLGRVDQDLKKRLDRLRALHRLVESDDERPDPLIKGTSIPVHMVAALARAQSVDEIIEDFPSLGREQVEAAIDYAKAYPKRGRPYPARSLKRALADLADLGAFDENVEPAEVTPRRIP